jgi:polyhydroxybutyrate depolymerase
MPLIVRRPTRRHVVLAAVATLALVLAGLVVLDARPDGAPAAASSGLGTISARGWTIRQQQLTVAGRHRGYLLARPVHPGRGKLPVVVLLHGRGMTPAGMLQRSGLLDTRPAIVVVPAGYGRSWNAGACCGPARAAGVDDVGFVTAVVGRAVDQPDADRRRVYLVGYSNGGRMAFRMACRRPRLFTAVAAVEAVSVYPCRSVAAPVPVLSVASTADPLLRIFDSAPPKRIDGRPQPSVDDVIRSWRTLDGCSGTPVRTQAGALDSLRWTACRSGAVVGEDLYAGGSHVWPGGSTLTPSAQARVWAFFSPAGPQPVTL